MSVLDSYNSQSGKYGFSKGPKEIYNALGDDGLFDVILSIPQEDADDEWGSTNRIAFERIIDRVGKLSSIVYDPLNSGKQGLRNRVTLIERVVSVGADDKDDRLLIGSTSIEADKIVFGGESTPVIETGASLFNIKVGDAVYAFGDASYNLPGIATELRSRSLLAIQKDSSIYLQADPETSTLRSKKISIGASKKSFQGSTQAPDIMGDLLRDNFTVDWQGNIKTTGHAEILGGVKARSIEVTQGGITFSGIDQQSTSYHTVHQLDQAAGIKIKSNDIIFDVQGTEYSFGKDGVSIPGVFSKLNSELLELKDLGLTYLKTEVGEYTDNNNNTHRTAPVVSMASLSVGTLGYSGQDYKGVLQRNFFVDHDGRIDTEGHIVSRSYIFAEGGFVASTAGLLRGTSTDAGKFLAIESKVSYGLLMTSWNREGFISIPGKDIHINALGSISMEANELSVDTTGEISIDTNNKGDLIAFASNITLMTANNKKLSLQAVGQEGTLTLDAADIILKTNSDVGSYPPEGKLYVDEDGFVRAV